MWQVRVIDADPDARKGQNEVTVKIISISEPVAPPEIQGLPFRPVVFDGLSVTPYVKENGGRPRVAYSLRAREMKAAAKPRGGERWVGPFVRRPATGLTSSRVSPDASGGC
ncbi:hypothetical protein [Curtobacterium sp. MCSS17_015]|uniref:hypothetical protein n=1 Tax=Curtobacterium sp. MCSS17_015 TaxID=2175666 RepID=UPI001C64C1FB|nr:hypothetical protein [Curtobacterium sp. MCSS17_015]WIB26620.1 hypothetical protein DEJ18_00585 [Curtobacterium sp. MCSS17_015]